MVAWLMKLSEDWIRDMQSLNGLFNFIRPKGMDFVKHLSIQSIYFLYNLKIINETGSKETHGM